MKRKKQELYTPDGLKLVESRLTDHRNALLQKCRELTQANEIDFEDAATLRDLAQFLTTTCLTLRQIPTCVYLAEHDKPQTVPHLDKCGLDALGDDSDAN